MTNLVLTSDPFRVLDRAEAMALPKATLTKVYAEFKLFGFDVPNANKDGFLVSDVTDEAIATLIGTPVYASPGLGEHPLKDASAEARARYVIGSVVLAEQRSDGVYCIAGLQRDTLKAYAINPDRLTEAFAVSMEVTFDRTKAKYMMGGKFWTLSASAIANKEYDVRYITPIDFHGAAILTKGRNADKGANFIRVAADAAVRQDPTQWLGARSPFRVEVKDEKVTES